jgi:membrane-associated protease RseP (regulator of RpoE activity)
MKFARSASSSPPTEPPVPEWDIIRLREAVADVFAVSDVTVNPAPRVALRLRGRLLIPARQAYELVSGRFRDLGYTPLLQREDGDDVILAVRGVIRATPSRPWLAALLFLATVASVVFAGMSMVEPPPGRTLPSPLAGLPFAVSLLSILLVHELGHYFVARAYGVPVSLPYFIPMPLGLFGTMGAFIRMKAPPTNRRVLVSIAAAGPLAGLVLAVPILIIGLLLSEVSPLPTGEPLLMEGNSLLYLGIKFLIFGRILPSEGMDVMLHPVALAGWVGLMVTALNLIPAGQLDGGHIVHALLGGRARWLTWLIIGAMLLLGFAWDGWFLWAALIFVFGQRLAAPLDSITTLDRPRQVLAVLVVIVFILIFTPVPLVIRQF